MEYNHLSTGITHSHTSVIPAGELLLTGFNKALVRPYALELGLDVSRSNGECSSILMYLASDSDDGVNVGSTFAWNCSKDSDSSCAFLPDSDGYYARYISLEVHGDRESVSVINDNICKESRRALPNRHTDTFFFGAGKGTLVPTVYKWMAVRKLRPHRPNVTVFQPETVVLEVLCPEHNGGTNGSAHVFLTQGVDNDDSVTKTDISSFPTPILTSLSRGQLLAEGGESLSLYGTRFPRTDFGTAVMIGNVSAKCSRHNDTEIHCKTPPFGSHLGNPLMFAGIPNEVSVSFDGQHFVKGDNVDVRIIAPEVCFHIASDSFSEREVVSEQVESFGGSSALNFKHGWEDILRGSRSSFCASRQALIFRNGEAGDRWAQTRSFNSLCGGTIKFSIIIGSWDSCSPTNLGSRSGSQSSRDGGASWTTVASFDATSNSAQWQVVSLILPLVARTKNTILRWYYKVDNIAEADLIWGIDDVSVELQPCSEPTLSPSLRINSISPNSGPLAGYTHVTLSGNFSDIVDKAVSCIFYSGREAPREAVAIYNLSSTSLVCISPKRENDGFVNVTLSVCGLKRATSPEEFYYYIDPVVVERRPSALSTRGGKLVFKLDSAFTFSQRRWQDFDFPTRLEMGKHFRPKCLRKMSCCHQIPWAHLMLRRASHGQDMAQICDIRPCTLGTNFAYQALAQETPLNLCTYRPHPALKRQWKAFRCHTS